MDNGFDYPNDLCVQNALWRRLDAIEILQIRLGVMHHKSAGIITFIQSVPSVHDGVKFSLYILPH